MKQDDKKTIAVNIRISENERKMLLKMASKKNKTVSEVIRGLIHKSQKGKKT